MKREEHLFRSIRLARWSANLARGFGLFCLGGALVLTAAMAFGHWGSPGRGLELFDWGIPAALLLALVGGWLARGSDAMTAARLDRRFGLRNRLESAVELRRGSHPIRKLQLKQAVQAWGRTPGVHRMLLHAPLLLVVALTVGEGFWARSCRAGLCAACAVEAAAEAEAAAAAEEKNAALAAEAAAEAEKQQAVPPVEAALEITYPDEKAEFMPIDLIEWEGAATGNAPWLGLELRLVLNGRALPSIPVALPDAADAEGKRYPGGVVALDELAAAPNDLISLQLTGQVEAAGSARQVFSAPVLLRIKPLRDELRIVDIPSGAAGAPFRDFYAYAMEQIRRQTELLRLFFAARGDAELGTAESEVLEMFALLAAEQGKLGDELNAFLLNEREHEGPGTISADMLLSLNQAVDAMRAAREALDRVPAPESRPAALEEAPAAQQRALAALNASLQELTREIRKRRDEPQSISSSPPEPKQQSNVLEQLDRAIQSETGLIADFRANGIRPALAETQGGVTLILQSLGLRQELSEATLAALSAAGVASGKAESAIPSNALRALESYTQEALAQMKEARRLIERQSLAVRSDAFGAARRALSAARRENRHEQNSDAEAASRAAEKLSEGASALEKAADELAGKGAPADVAALREAGKKMAALAGKLGGLSRSEAATELENLRRELKEAQGNSPGGASGENSGQGGANQGGALREKLDRLRKEAAYLAKNPQSGSQEWLEDLALQIEDLQDYLDAVDPARSQPEINRLRERTAGIPDQLDGWFYAGIDAGAYVGIAEELGAVSRLLDEVRQSRSAPTEMFMFAPDQVPEEYRELAAAYFEVLSRRRADAGRDGTADASGNGEEKP